MPFFSSFSLFTAVAFCSLSRPGCRKAQSSPNVHSPSRTKCEHGLDRLPGGCSAYGIPSHRPLVLLTAGAAGHRFCCWPSGAAPFVSDSAFFTAFSAFLEVFSYFSFLRLLISFLLSAFTSLLISASSKTFQASASVSRFHLCSFCSRMLKPFFFKEV